MAKILEGRPPGTLGLTCATCSHWNAKADDFGMCDKLSDPSPGLIAGIHPRSWPSSPSWSSFVTHKQFCCSLWKDRPSAKAPKPEPDRDASARVADAWERRFGP